MYHDGPFDLKSRAIIYIRVSTARLDMVSPEQQFKVCSDFAVSNDFTVVGDPVQDIDISGRSFDKRQVNKMIERIRAGEAGTILVWQYSRWARNAGLGMAYLKLLEQAGGQLIAVTEAADTKTPSGLLQQGMMLQFAEYYSNVVGAGWKQAHAYRIGQGLPINGGLRFGYTRCPDCKRKEDRPEAFLKCKSCNGIFMIHPVNGPALGVAYEMRVSGKGFPYIVTQLTKAGIRSTDGHILSNQALAKSLDSGFGAGLICLDRRPQIEGKRLTTDIREYIFHPGAHAAVVEPEVWEAYFDKRINNFKTNPTQLYARHSVSGIFRCGEILESGEMCAGSLTVGGNNSEGIAWFRCSNSKSFKTCGGKQAVRTRLEEHLKGWVLTLAQDDGVALAAMKQAAQRQDLKTDVERLQHLLNAAKVRSRNLQDGRLNGDFDRDYYLDKKKEIDGEISSLEDQLREIGGALDTKVPSPREFQGLLAIWDRLPPEDLNAALKKLISYATVRRTGFDRRFYEYRVIPRWEAEPLSLRLHNPGNPTPKSDTPPDQ